MAERGDLVTVALSGDFAKPRPALVIQSDRFEGTATLTILLISSELVDAPLIRLSVEPSDQNGLRSTSQIMIDKAMTVRREKIGRAFGRIDGQTMTEVNRRLALFFGLA